MPSDPPPPMYPTLVYVSPPGTRITAAVADLSEVYFETRGDDVTRLWRAPPGHPPTEVAVVANPHPDRCLVAAEEDGLICREADDTLVVIQRVGGDRNVLRRLTPAPIAITITPEHVVWCSTGEVWRWWRGTNTRDIEKVGTHTAAKPLLAIRPVPLPYPPSRIASDIAIADTNRIGLIDADCLDWLAETEQSPTRLACTTTAILWTTDRLTRMSLDSEIVQDLRSLVATTTLVTHGDRIFFANNCIRVPDAVEGLISDPPANVAELVLRSDHERSYPLDDNAWTRDAMELAATSNGLYLIDTGTSHDNIDRLTYLPHTWTAIDRAATLQIQRWLPDGRGGHLMIEQGTWWSAGASGDVPPDATARINEWLRENFVSGEYQVRTPRLRGWQVTVGVNVWFAAHGDRVTVAARQITELVAILAPHIAPLRRWQRLV